MLDKWLSLGLAWNLAQTHIPLLIFGLHAVKYSKLPIILLYRVCFTVILESSIVSFALVVMGVLLWVAFSNKNSWLDCWHTCSEWWIWHPSFILIEVQESSSSLRPYSFWTRSSYVLRIHLPSSESLIRMLCHSHRFERLWSYSAHVWRKVLYLLLLAHTRVRPIRLWGGRTRLRALALSHTMLY